METADPPMPRAMVLPTRAVDRQHPVYPYQPLSLPPSLATSDFGMPDNSAVEIVT